MWGCVCVGGCVGVCVGVCVCVWITLANLTVKFHIKFSRVYVKKIDKVLYSSEMLYGVINYIHMCRICSEVFWFEFLFKTHWQQFTRNCLRFDIVIEIVVFVTFYNTGWIKKTAIVMKGKLNTHTHTHPHTPYLDFFWK